MEGVNLIVAGKYVDLFDFESITLKRIIKDSKNPKNLFTDYSRSFTVPASRNNNKIFKHYYRADITNGIDARSMIDAEIRLNHINYKKGNVEVLGVDMKEGKPFAYRIVFYGKLTELSKRIGSDKLSALSLNKFDHDSSFANIKSRLADHDGSLFGNDIIYPLISRFDRFVLDSSSSYAVGLDNTKNIQFVDNTKVGSDYGVERADLVPALRVGSIIEEIENKYGIVFKGVVKEPTIDELYLGLHKSSSTSGSKVTKVVDGFNTQDELNGVTVDSTSKYFTLTNFDPFSSATGDDRKRVYVIPNTTSTEWNLKLISSKFGVVASSNQENPVLQYDSKEITDTFHFVIEADASDTFTFPITITDRPSDVQVHSWNISDTMSDEFIVSRNIPNVRVMDFLGDIFKRFNIVAEVIGTEVTTYFYNHYMSLGSTIDVSKWIDNEKFTIDKPNIYSGVEFSFKDVDTVLNKGFEQVNGRTYGELDYHLEDTQGNKIAGSSYDIKLDSTLLPLENIQGTNNGIVYSYLADEKGKEQKTNLYFFYTKPKTDLSIAYNNNTTVDEVLSYRMPSNFRRGDSNQFYNSLSFSEEIDEHTVTSSYYGVSAFNIHYSGLISQLFDENRRVHKYTSYIPLSVLRGIGLNDRLKISGRLYIISSIDTNYKTRQTNLELISIEQGDLTPYTLKCRTYTNTSTTENSNLVYMDADGKIQYLSIDPEDVIEVCSIGEVFHNSLEIPSVEAGDEGDDGDDGTTGEFSANLVATSNIPNTNVTYSPNHVIYDLNDGDAFSITATVNADTGYQIDSSSPSNSYTFSGTIAGASASDSVTFTGTSSVIDTGDTNEYTVDLTINNLAGGSVNIDDVATTTKSFTGTAGTQFTTLVSLFLQTNSYWSTFPTASGGTTTVQGNTGYDYTNPVYAAETNDYFKRVVVPLVVTIPNSNVSDTVTMNGSSTAAPRVIWEQSNGYTNAAGGSQTFSYLSLEIDGESPSVSLVTGGAFASLSGHTYSNNQGSVTLTYSNNTTTSDRVAQLRVTASTDSSTDDVTLTQYGATQSTSGSITGGAVEFNALDNQLTDTIYITANGLWSLTSDANGVSFSPSNGALSSNQLVTVTWDETAQTQSQRTITLNNTGGTVLDTETMSFTGTGGNSFDYWTAQAQDGTVANFQFDASYVLGDVVYTSIDSQEWTITGSGSQSVALTNTITGLVTTTTTTTTTTTLPPYYNTTLYTGFNSSDACSQGGVLTVYHSSSGNPLGNYSIYTDTALTTAAPSGWYSNGSNVSNWNGSSWGSVNSCGGGGQ